MTRTLDARSDEPDAVLEALTTSLQDGGVIVVPTDTVYAVVADAFHRDGVATLRELRGMAPRDPLSVLVRSPKQLPGITAEVPPEAERLMAAFWPGPLTLILHAATTMQWDIGRTDGTVAVRMPMQELVIELARRVGPLVASAAVPVDQPGPQTLAEALAALGEPIAAALDDGARPDARRSTVVDLTRSVGEVVREGALPAELVIGVATGDIDPVDAFDRLGDAVTPSADGPSPTGPGDAVTPSAADDTATG